MTLTGGPRDAAVTDLAEDAPPGARRGTDRPRLGLRGRRLPTDADVTLLLLIAAAVVVRSLWWPPLGDVGLMHHLGRLAAEGHVPYRDVFEMNLPGTWALHGLAAAVLGTSDAAIRVLDLVWLGLTCWAGVRVVAPFGRPARRAAVAALTIGYLACGPYNALERDWLVIAPFLVAVDGWRRGDRRGRILAGAALGVALLFRPQPVLLLAATVVAAAFTRPVGAPATIDPVGHRLRRSSEVVAGTALPLGVTALVLAAMDALGPFVDIWTRYVLPLYSRLGENGREREATDSLDVLANSMVRTVIDQVEVLVPMLLAVGALSVAARRCHDLQRRTIAGMSALALYGAAHVVLSNRVWLYYWLPFVAACLLLAVVLFSDRPSLTAARPFRPLALVALLVLGIRPFVLPHDRFPDAAHQQATIDGAATAIERVAAPGDRLQIFALTGTASRIADRVGLAPCTGFVYDLHFFHDTEDPRIRALRSRFLEEFGDDPCRFILVWKQSWNRDSLEEIARFPEFARILDEQYRTTYEDERMRVMERTG